MHLGVFGEVILAPGVRLAVCSVRRGELVGVTTVGIQVERGDRGVGGVGRVVGGRVGWCSFGSHAASYCMGVCV